jgi:membrane protein required for colicin V production
MNALDIILAIPMAYLIWKGYRRGLTFEVTSLAGIMLGCWIAVHFSVFVAKILGLKGGGAALVAFFITFVAVVVLSLLLGKFIQRVFKVTKLGVADHLVGALIGFLKSLCILGVLLSFLVMIDKHEIILKPTTKESSVFYKPVDKTGNWLVSSLKTYVAQKRYDKAMNEQGRKDS